MESTPELEPGTALGSRYTVLSKLGEGGMGCVYKAIDKELDRVVALKVIRPELAQNPGVMRRFKHEVLLASRISHPNILRVHDLGDLGTLRFITMAYVEGHDLQQAVDEKHRIPVQDAVTIAKQILQALDAAHTAGVVHRDLKPRNILLDLSGRIYVTDFGLAKSLAEQSSGELTQTGELLGTPRYMAPEQVECKEVDHRADIYSFGLVLYEMLTGESPFQAKTAWDAMYLRTRQRPSSPRRILPDLPQALERVLLRCLEHDPADRYQSARDVLIEIDKIRPRKRWWSARAAGAAVVVAVLGSAGFLLTAHSQYQFIPEFWKSQAPVRIAVLPFSITSAPETKYVAEGITDSLCTRLSQLHNVRLAAPSTVGELLAKGEPAEKVAKEMGAALILRANYQQTGPGIAISIRLDEPASGKTLWHEEFTGVQQDVLTMQDRIYNALLGALKIRPAPEESARAVTSITPNYDAYDLYLKGQNLIRRMRDPKNLEQILAFYDAATAKDPRFALAYAAIAEASIFMHRAKSEPEWADRALGAARHAAQLNDSLPEVHLAVASAAIETGKTTEGIAELRRASQLAPGSDEVYRRLGAAYRGIGQSTAAVEACRRAVEINPYYWFNHNQLGIALVEAGDATRALKAFTRVAELVPANYVGWANMGMAHFRLGQWEQAIEDYKQALSKRAVWALYVNLGTVYYFSGRYAESREAYEKGLALNPKSYWAIGGLADTLLGLGQQKPAENAYDRAIALAYDALRKNPNDATVFGYLAVFYAHKHDAANADQFIARARSIKPSDTTILYQQACLDALNSRRERAIADVRQLVAMGFSAREIVSTPELRAAIGPELQRLVASPAHAN